MAYVFDIGTFATFHFLGIRFKDYCNLKIGRQYVYLHALL